MACGRHSQAKHYASRRRDQWQPCRLNSPSWMVTQNRTSFSNGHGSRTVAENNPSATWTERVGKAAG